MTKVQDLWTVLDALQWTRAFFTKAGCESPRLDAELLLADVLKIERLQLYVQYERPLAPEEKASYRQLIKRRANGEPVQYILGEREFWSLPFFVEPGVLIPRPDTETLVELALTEIDARLAAGREQLRVADVGTGSGCIGITLAHQRPEVVVHAVDINPVPVRVATRNAARHNLSERFIVRQGDGLKAFSAPNDPGPFDIIVSNPPYIREDEFPELMREVRDHEPRDALVSGLDGMNLIRQLISDTSVSQVLQPDGVFLIEIGSLSQAEETAQLLESNKFSTTSIHNDLGKRPRVVVGSRLAR